MIQTLTSLSSHGCAPAYARQILYMLSWLPLANNCSSKCPSKHPTALTQTLANTRQSSSHQANYDPITIDVVLLTTYLAASHVHACTPLATTKTPSNSRQTTLQRHHNVMPTTAKRPCSVTITSCQPPPNEPSAPQKQPPKTSSTSCMQLCYSYLTTAKHLVYVLYAAVLQLPFTLQTIHKRPSIILLPSCQSLVTHLRFTCPTIALLLRDN